MRPCYIVVALVLSLSGNASAQDTDQAYRDSIARRLFSATNLLCEWGEGTVAIYEGILGVDSGPDLESDNTLTPSVLTDIDLDRQTVSFFSSSVGVFRSGPGLNFVETTLSGNLILTTVFATVFNDSGAYVAVTSRHLGQVVGAPPVPSQFHGSCTPF